MRKKPLIIPLLVLIIGAIAACNGTHSGSSADSSAGSPMVTTPQQDSLGRKLMVNSDCFTCHKLDAKLIGPCQKGNKWWQRALGADSHVAAPGSINGRCTCDGFIYTFT
jgi:hypothetical protein